LVGRADGSAVYFADASNPRAPVAPSLAAAIRAQQ
jgi:hypothetical protein